MEKENESNINQRQSEKEWKQQLRCGKVCGVSSLDGIYHYMMCAGMIIATSEGESMVFGMEKGEVLKDLEGLDIIENLADNMAWIMKMKQATADTVPKPELKDRAQMNFIAGKEC